MENEKRIAWRFVDCLERECTPTVDVWFHTILNEAATDELGGAPNDERIAGAVKAALDDLDHLYAIAISTGSGGVIKDLEKLLSVAFWAAHASDYAFKAFKTNSEKEKEQ